MGSREIIAQLIRILVQAESVLPAVGGGVLAWFKALPSIYRLVLDLQEFVILVHQYIDILSKVKEFRDAIQVAKTTGNTSELEKLFGGTGAPVHQPDPQPPHPGGLRA